MPKLPVRRQQPNPVTPQVPIPGDFPAIPDEVLERFPSAKDWQRRLNEFWGRTQQALQESQRQTAAQVNSQVIWTVDRFLIYTNNGGTMPMFALDDTGVRLGNVLVINTPGRKVYIGRGEYQDAQTPFYIDTLGRFSLGANLTWDPDTATLNVTGTITATSGTIGGFDIGADYIRDSINSFGLASTVTGGDDVRFWAGSTFANRATAPFRVYESGLLVATGAQIADFSANWDAGTYAAGDSIYHDITVTGIGAGGGATGTVYGTFVTAKLTGTQNVSGVVGGVLSGELAGTAGTASIVRGAQPIVVLSGGASATNASVCLSGMSFTGTGNITSNLSFFSAGYLTVSSTGDVTGAIQGFLCENIGRAAAANGVTGFYCNNLTGPAAGAYRVAAFRGEVTAGTGKYNLYMGGTAVNYFAADIIATSIGATTPGSGAFTTLSTSGALTIKRSTDAAKTLILSLEGGNFDYLGTGAGYSHIFSVGGTEYGRINATGFLVTGVVDINGTAASATAGHLQIGSSTQSTIGANGAASALTANPLGYISAYLGATHIIIPYYNA